MRPANLKTRIFLDGGNPDDTKDIIHILGFLDGQTTNPTLISKNPDLRERIERGEKFTGKEILTFYRQVVRKISLSIPEGSVSAEVYADGSTRTEEMQEQAEEMFSWIPNAHIKFPSTREGLKAAEQTVKRGLRINMTLCFTQEQAAAVHAATRGAKRGDVFVSPFIGRLDDRGENGMDLIDNIIKMYENGHGHVEVLTASVRNIDHLMYALKLGSDIISAPFNILKQWADQGLPIPDDSYVYDSKHLKRILYREIDLYRNWQDYDIRHELTDQGIDRFSADWKALFNK